MPHERGGVLLPSTPTDKARVGQPHGTADRLVVHTGLLSHPVNNGKHAGYHFFLRFRFFSSDSSALFFARALWTIRVQHVSHFYRFKSDKELLSSSAILWKRSLRPGAHQAARSLPPGPRSLPPVPGAPTRVGLARYAEPVCAFLGRDLAIPTAKITAASASSLSSTHTHAPSAMDSHPYAGSFGLQVLGRLAFLVAAPSTASFPACSPGASGVFSPASPSRGLSARPVSSFTSVPAPGAFLHRRGLSSAASSRFYLLRLFHGRSSSFRL